MVGNHSNKKEKGYDGGRVATAVCFVGSVLKWYRLKTAKARRLKCIMVSMTSAIDVLYTFKFIIHLRRKRAPTKRLVAKSEACGLSDTVSVAVMNKKTLTRSTKPVQ